MLTSSLGTVTVRTPFSIEALIWSILAFSGSRNLLENLPLLRSTRCHVSFLSSFSTFLCPLIWSTLSSSISTFTSSFLSPGRSALKTWASGVSLQSMRVFTKAGFSRERRGFEEEMKGAKSLNGSQMSNDENGSKMLLPRWLSKKLGINAISLFFLCRIQSFGLMTSWGILDCLLLSDFS
ncbi:hypothetical protein NC651_023060 [Populus alba x Populus x berolinensis]|nr:hypothetical protein NC651_023060 [Populus alba x Populus x berolinensis]